MPACSKLLIEAKAIDPKRFHEHLRRCVRKTIVVMVLVMDFDSADAVTRLFEFDDYAALVAVRDQDFAEMNIQLTYEM